VLQIFEIYCRRKNAVTDLQLLAFVNSPAWDWDLKGGAIPERVAPSVLPEVVIVRVIEHFAVEIVVNNKVFVMTHRFKLGDSVIIKSEKLNSMIVDIKRNDVKVVYWDNNGQKHYRHCEPKFLEPYPSMGSDEPKM
jgi:hypothetical protein